MTFPVIVFTDMAIWYNTVINVLFILGIVGVLLFAIFSDEDIDDYANLAVFLFIGVIVVSIVALMWGIILAIGIVAGIIFGGILALRHLRVKAFDWYYYRQEM